MLFLVSQWQGYTTAAIQKVILQFCNYFYIAAVMYPGYQLPGNTISSLYCGCRTAPQQVKIRLPRFTRDYTVPSILNKKTISKNCLVFKKKHSCSILSSILGSKSLSKWVFTICLIKDVGGNKLIGDSSKNKIFWTKCNLNQFQGNLVVAFDWNSFDQND